MDTLKNTNMLFSILAENISDKTYGDDIFSITCYFLNKLMSVRSASIQKKFKGFFKNDSGCFSFFKKIDKYIKIQTDKISKGSLKQFFVGQKYTDELAAKPYYVDKNLEKQIVDLLKYLCKNGNTWMQNYMKKQYNNSRSFNMVSRINEFTKSFMDHLHFPVPFDTFISCLRCLLEFIQGPNKVNQNILILNDFVEVANIIFMMKYHEDEKKYIERMLGEQGDSQGTMTFTRTKQMQSHSRISSSIGKSSNRNKLFQDHEITMPGTNYMISSAKYRVLLLLNHLLDGYDPSDYVYYLYRREIDPIGFRINFANQQYFHNKIYHSSYTTNLFFRYSESLKDASKSPFIIEIGFQCYFLIKKMEDNLKLDYDQRYQSKIADLLPAWDKPQNKPNHNIFIESSYFIRDCFRSIKNTCFKVRNYSYNEAAVKRMVESDKEITNILNFYENKSAQIEILMNGELQEFFFPRLPYCRFQISDDKDEFLANVNRTNEKTKCEDLVRNSKIMLSVLKIDYWIRNNLGNILGLIPMYLELWKNLMQVLALAINFVIIAAYSDKIGNRTWKPTLFDISETNTEMLIYILGGINCWLAFIVLIIQLATRIPYNVQKYRIIQSDTNKKTKDSEAFAIQIEAEKAYDTAKMSYDLTVMILTDSLIIYHLLYFIFIVLGLALHPFFFAFCLTYLIVRSPVLINVLKAAYEPRFKILLTLFLFVIVAYFFSIFAFYQYYKDYDSIVQNG